MSLITQIDQDLISAMKSGDQTARETLRLLKSSFKNALINDGKAELTDEEAISLIQKEVKKRKEAIAAYEQADKPDLAAAEASEIAVLEKYLPSQMAEAAIRLAVQKYLTTNPTDLAQMGKAMGALSGELKGQADLGLVSKILREELSK